MPGPLGNHLDDVKLGMPLMFSDGTKVDSFCEPPSVPAKEINERNGRPERPVWVRFPANYDNPNTPFCPAGLYLKNTNGRNCCVSEENKATPQEVLNFVNEVIRSYFQNANTHEGKDSKKNKAHRDAMHYYRHYLLTNHKGLHDDLGFNFEERLIEDNKFVNDEPTQEDITEEDELWDKRNPDGTLFYSRNTKYPKPNEKIIKDFAAIAKKVLTANADLRDKSKSKRGGRTRRKNKTKKKRRGSLSRRRLRR
jgi:hypothetical protein